MDIKKKEMKKLKPWVQGASKTLGVAGLIAIGALLVGFPLMLLINYVYPPAEITFWQAVAIFVIVKILEPSKPDA